MKFKGILSATFLVTSQFIISNLYAQVNWGLNLGLNYSNINAISELRNEIESHAIPRMNVGLSVDFPIYRDLYVQPTLMYSGKGYRSDAGEIGFTKDFKARVSYLELPVQILFKPEVGSGSMVIGVGPYIAYGLGGKWKSPEDVLIGDILIPNQGDIEFNKNGGEADYGTYVYGKPWDYGGKAALGYEFLRKYLLQFNYQWGMADIMSSWGEDKRNGSIKTEGFGLSVGYKF